MICSRAMLSEAMKMIPAKEQPTKEVLEGYIQVTASEEDLAWSEDYFLPLLAWMHDREVRRKRAEIERSEFQKPGDIGQYNYSR